MKSIIRHIVATGAILAVPVIGSAQEATLSGTVTDSTGGVLPGVTVRAVHEASGNTFQAVTDPRGAYRIPVRTGTFRVTAELDGFTTITRSGLELLIGQQAVVNIEMKPSTVQESVTVTAEAPLLDTTGSKLGGNIDPRQMQELPVNGRNPMDLVMLAPGNRSNAVGDAPVEQERGNFQINIDGQQVTQIIASSNSFGQPRFSRDAIAEFEFVANRFDATQGRSSGVQVNAITKSGANRPAGTFGAYFRSDKFNAEDFIAKKVLPYSDQQLSTTYGGPIQKDRIHFFGAYEYERNPSTFLYNTPYPAFNLTPSMTRIENKSLAKLDFQFSPKTHMAVRGTQWNNLMPINAAYAGGATTAPSSDTSFDRYMYQLHFDLTKIISNKAVNDLKWGYASYYWEAIPNAKWTNAPSGRGVGAPEILLRGITIGQTHTNDPQKLGQEDYSIRDDFTYSFEKGGRHDVRTGGEFIYDLLWEFVCRACMGIIDARGGPPPGNLESLFPDPLNVDTWNLKPLSPLVRSYSIGVGDFTARTGRKIFATWLQDDYRPTGRLTLNLGIRWDVPLDQWANDTSIPPFLAPGRPQELKDIQPRLGFAYTLNDKTVVRGGFGKYYANVTSNLTVHTISFSRQAQPTLTGAAGFMKDVSTPFNGPIPTYQQVLADPNQRTNITDMVSPNISNPYSWQLTIGVQRQLTNAMAVDTNYVYTGERETLVNQNINLAYNPDTGANYPFTTVNVLPYPKWGTVSPAFPAAWSNYHAWQTAFTKRFSERWQASASYLLSLFKEGTPGPLGLDGQPRVSFPLVPDEGPQYGYGVGDQRVRVVVNGVWQIGYGFQLSGLYFFGSGERFATTYGGDLRQTGGGGGRLRPNGTIVPRNNFVGLPIHRVDMRLQRRFKLGRMGIDGVFEAFNLFNHENYGSYTTDESNANYGKPQQNVNAAYQSRQLQLGFRTTF